MRHLSKYRIFETLNSRGSRSLTEKEFDEILKKNCKNWTKAKTSIYRGQRDLGSYVYTDPKGKYRNSIEDTNLHLELMDNLPSWSEYPKYSESVIGISEYASMASGYGVTYEVIPFDNVKIGICPESTIWQSFSDEEWGDDIYLIRDFLESLGIDAENYDEIKNLKSAKGIKRSDSFFSTSNQHRINSFLDKITSPVASGIECFNFINDELFNPNKRGFKLKEYEAGFEIEKGKQVWTNGPVLLINNDLV